MKNLFFCLIVYGLFGSGSNQLFAQGIVIKGYITEKDTISTIPFAYVVNKKNGTGTVCSDKGYFELSAQLNDTILISSIGFVARKIATKDILELPTFKAKRSIVLFSKTYNLNTVIINPRELSENQKSVYERFINQPQPSLTSPISALYYEYSKEGRERKKLVEIYKRELFFEKTEKRLDYFFAVKKVDLTTFDARAFILFCRITEDFVEEATDYEFYYKVTRCFDEYTGNADYR